MRDAEVCYVQEMLGIGDAGITIKHNMRQDKSMPVKTNGKQLYKMVCTRCSWTSFINPKMNHGWESERGFK